MAKDADPWIADESLHHLEGPIGGAVIDHDQLLEAGPREDPTEHLPEGAATLDGRVQV